MQSKLIQLVLAGSLLSSNFLLANEKNIRKNSQEFVDGQIIVKFNQPVNFGEQNKTGILSIDKKLADYKITKVKKLFPHHKTRKGVKDLSQIYELQFDKSYNAKKVASVFANDKSLAYAEPRFIFHTQDTPNDPAFSTNQAYLTAKLQVVQAWDIAKAQNSATPIILGMVDSGVDLDHPDLAANIWINPNEIQNNGIDDDNNGYIDDYTGWDFTGNDANNPGAIPDNDPNDQFGHGTHTAGDAAAVTNNGIGVAGISWNPKILAIKTGANSTAIFHGYEGIVYAAENGASIISCSWGGAGGGSLGLDVIDFAYSMGAVVVAAAGNDAVTTPHYPSSYPKVLSVVATGNTYSKANYSNYGISSGISAPGSSIYNTNVGGGYVSQSGTSMACPIVSGGLALVKAIHPTWSNMQVLQQVRVSADSALYNVNPSSYDWLMGKGGLNAFRAVTLRSPAIRMETFEFDDTVGGDGDGVLDPGETITLNVDLFNYLSPAENTTVGIVTTSPYITVTQGTTNVGLVDSLGLVTATLGFTVSPTAPKNAEIIFRIYYQSLTSYGYYYYDFEHFNAFTRPNFVTHNSGNLQLSVTDEGNVGHVETAGETGGIGFIFNDDGKDLMYEGSMIIARSATQVADAARTSGTNPQSADFINNGADIVMDENGLIADQSTDVTFVTAPASPLTGLSIRQRTFSFSNAPDDDYVILHYELTNTSNQTLTGVYVGYYFDWDVDNANYGTNQVGYDATNNLGYVFDNNFPTHAGISALTGTNTHRAISNQNDLFDTQGFTDAEKFQFVSEGFSIPVSSIQEDQSETISSGPFTIAPNQKAVAAFAILGGDNLADLQANAQAAALKYQAILPFLTSLRENADVTPEKFELLGNYPNPFNPTTEIKFQVPGASKVEFSIFNVKGQLVKTLSQEVKQAGTFTQVWDGTDNFGKNVASGVYFYQFKAGNYSKTMKMTLIK
ncbi:S8 family serine peptidase [bacterium]|nr:S8 family serine peptidase [bacterium]